MFDVECFPPREAQPFTRDHRVERSDLRGHLRSPRRQILNLVQRTLYAAARISRRMSINLGGADVLVPE